MSRTGLLAGTFDPVHDGHVALAEAAANVCGLKEVWLMVNPQVVEQDSSKVAAPFVHRMAMARLAVADVPRVRVYEGSLAGRPHTLATFDGLAHEEGIDPVFVLGMDAFCRLDRWDDVQSVVGRATFAVARRSGVPGRELSGLRLRLGELAEALKLQEFVFEGLEDLSSSRVKAGLRRGEVPAGLDSKVHEYILTHDLYR